MRVAAGPPPPPPTPKNFNKSGYFPCKDNRTDLATDTKYSPLAERNQTCRGKSRDHSRPHSFRSSSVFLFSIVDKEWQNSYPLVRGRSLKHGSELIEELFWRGEVSRMVGRTADFPLFLLFLNDILHTRNRRRLCLRSPNF